jgi:hypothetical protein
MHWLPLSVLIHSTWVLPQGGSEIVLFYIND